MTEAEYEVDEGEAKHKEKLPGCRYSDAIDHNKPIAKLDKAIDPHNLAGHPKSGPINIVTFNLAYSAFIVHHSVHCGRAFCEANENNLPSSFYDTINAGVKTKAYTGSHMKASSKLITNPNAINNHALPLLNSGNIDLYDVCHQTIRSVDITVSSQRRVKIGTRQFQTHAVTVLF